MTSDVTIYVSARLIGTGGTIILVPYTTADPAWPSSIVTENPAAADPTLDADHPLGEGDRRLGVVVDDPISIVRFAVAENGTYVFRFRPAPDAPQTSDARAPIKIGSGSSTETDPASGVTEEFPDILTFHLPGAETDEGASREARGRARLGLLEKRYSCRAFEGALSCDGTRDKIDG